MTAVDGEATMSLGEASKAVGVPASTLRSWGDRYDVGPTARTPGGHRRYSDLDVERLCVMRALIDQGTPASMAARAATVSTRAAEAAEGRALPDAGALPAELRPGVFVPLLVDAASRLDAPAARDLYRRALRLLGVVRAWDEVIVPGLRAIGQEWADGVIGIEAEHLSSHALASELRSWPGVRPQVDGGRPVVLAAVDDHSLPLLALEAALAEQQVAVRPLGARLPTTVLERSIDQLDPSAVFVWASLPAAGPEVDRIRRQRPGVVFVVGGPGWGRRHPAGADDLRGAVQRLADAHRAAAS